MEFKQLIHSIFSPFYRAGGKIRFCSEIKQSLLDRAQYIYDTYYMKSSASNTPDPYYHVYAVRHISDCQLHHNNICCGDLIDVNGEYCILCMGDMDEDDVICVRVSKETLSKREEL